MADYKEAFERILAENSSYNRRIQLIMNELSRNPLSNGLSDIQAIRALHAELEQLQACVREITAENIVLKNKMYGSREVFLRELLELLKK